MNTTGWTRRSLLAAGCTALFMPALAQPRFPLTVTDAVGRNVTISRKPKAILLGTGFNLVALSLIHPDPVSLLAGWASDMQGDNPFLFDAFRRKFSRLDSVPVIGNGAADGFSFEIALSIKADLAVLGMWQAEGEQGERTIAYLESIGVPTVVVDFNRDPLANTPRDIRLLGRILECDDKAQAYARLFESKLAHIRQCVEQASGAAPLVLMDAFPSQTRGSWAIGRSGLGELVTLAGGRNIADKTMPAQGGPVTAEYVLAADPDVYIATGSPGATYGAFSIGPGVEAGQARRTLRETVAMANIAPLKAVQSGRVHGLWNFFNAVPLNILAAEAVATWVRPELSVSIDPLRSLAELNEKFLPVPLEGAYWISLTGP